MKYIYIPISILLVCLILFSCDKLKSDNLENCKSLKLKVNKTINDYYFSHRTNSLDSALVLIDSSLKICDSSSGWFIQQKIDVLILKQNYAKAYEYVNSIDGNVFQFSYKKTMYLNGINALNYESDNHLRKRDSCYKLVANEIQKYINSSNSSSEQVYADLFITKKQ